MHGLILAAFQAFFKGTYGEQQWKKVTMNANVADMEFEAMLNYDTEMSYKVIDCAAEFLGRARDEMLEDLGTYIVSDPSMGRFRRLLRFSGVDYVDFLHSLEELPERARLAVSDLHLPAVELLEKSPGLFRLECQQGLDGYSAVLLGVLRAMADDYGALVMLEKEGQACGRDVLIISLIETSYAEGKRFELKSGLHN